ncbi:MAG: hypothetical protein HYX75_05855 [Acidobacteria bacterium]|nr:hypothetical protein [Acidobacteriota bacterium]
MDAIRTHLVRRGPQVLPLHTPPSDQSELGLRPVKTHEVDHAFFKEFDG